MASNNFNPVAEELITKFKKILEGCIIQTDKPQEPSLIQKYREDLERLKSDMEDPPKLTVAVYGDTGSGKSTLLNAVLDQPNLVPKAAMGKACTSFAIKIEENKDGADFAAEIEFLTKEEWYQELDVLTRDLKDPDPEGDKSTSESAKAMMKAVYGKIDKPTLEELKNIKNDVTAKLKSEATDEPYKINCSNAKSLKEKLWKFIDSGKKEEGQVWPIVKQIILRVPSSCLCTSGIVFIDLPGVGDSNPARDRVAWKYVLDSDVLMVVTHIQRAVDSKTAEDIIGKRMHRHAKMDGLRTVIVCTHSDVIDPEEVIERLDVTEAAEMTEKLKELKKSKKEKDQQIKALKALKAKNKTQAQEPELCDTYESLTNLTNEIEKLQKDRTTLCATKRNAYVKDEMRSSNSEEKAMKVFCVSSTDYNKLRLSESPDLDYDTTIFTTVEQTEIPALKKFLTQASEDTREKKRKSIKSDFWSLVSGLYTYLTNVELACMKDQATLKNDVSEKLDAFGEQTYNLISKVEKAIEKTLQDNLNDAIDMGVEAAEKEAPFVCSSWSIPVDMFNRSQGGLAFNTYKATVSRYGKYRKKKLDIDVDMNGDLCFSLIYHMVNPWATTFSEETWRDIKEKQIKAPFSGIIETVTTEVTKSVKRAPGLDGTAVSDNIKQIRDVANEKLSNSLDEIWDLVHKQSQDINSKLADTIKRNMTDTYNDCRCVTGKGAFQAIKEIMAKGIDQKKRSMFEDAKKEVKAILDQLKSEVVSKVTEILLKIYENYRNVIEALWNVPTEANVWQSKEDLASVIAALEKFDENKGTKRKRED